MAGYHHWTMLGGSEPPVSLHIDHICGKAPLNLAAFLNYHELVVRQIPWFFFQDMKKFNYYYWFAYPCLSEPMVEQIGSCKAINEHFNQPQFDAFNQQYFARKNSEQQQFFIIEADGDLGDGVLYSQLADKISSNNKEANFAEAAVQNLYFCYSDPCATPDVAGWTARLYLTMIIHLW